MQRKRLFVSFDNDNDSDLKMLLVPLNGWRLGVGRTAGYIGHFPTSNEGSRGYSSFCMLWCSPKMGRGNRDT